MRHDPEAGRTGMRTDGRLDDQLKPRQVRRDQAFVVAEAER